MKEGTLNLHVTEMNDQRRAVFLNRYALRNTAGETIETDPAEMWVRVANAIGQTDPERKAFTELLWDFKFVPGGRILAGAGTETEVTYYNCYVIPIETKNRRENRFMHDDYNPEYIDRIDTGSDSREAILDTISVMVDIMSRGGGVGINWSVLRPKGTHLSRVNGTTSGPVSWMDVASHAVQTVTQGGSRRGAAMFMLDDWHPDIMEFIDAKRNLDKITGANVSVAVSDKFMRVLAEDGTWTFRFPDTTDPRYDSQWDGDLAGWEASGGLVVDHGSVPASELWTAISTAAHHNGEPGIVFLDRYNAQSTGSGVERIICVNPCGEQGLGPYSVCNLGSMNLDAYIKPFFDYKMGAGKFEFDWDQYDEDCRAAVTFLDNVIDQNFYFLPENEKIQKDLRRIGLGVMGLADAMLALGIRYGSPESVEFTEKIFRTMKDASIEQSVALGSRKGAAPAWSAEMWGKPYFKEYLDRNGYDRVGHGSLAYPPVRNVFLLTQAPTGSTSILAGVNSGIEPYFAFKYKRVDRTGEHIVYASAVEKYKDPAIDYGENSEWVTSEGVTVEEHIAIQAAVQKYVDSSVSKTINAPNSHTVEDTEKAYTLAYSSGLKGLAYFRDGNGRDQVLYKEEPELVENLSGTDDWPAPSGVTTGDLWAEYTEYVALAPHLTEYRRPDVLDGTTTKQATRAGTAYVTVNRDPSGGRPVEVFFNVGKAGSEVAALAEGLGRLASLALRSGAGLPDVAGQLNGVGGSSQFNQSIPNAIATALTTENARHSVVPAGQVPPVEEVSLTVSNPDGTFEFKGRLVASEPTTNSTRFDLCPDCHNASLSYQEGCSKCALCGYSAC